MYNGKIKISKIKTNNKIFKTQPSKAKMDRRRTEYAIDHKLYIVICDKTKELVDGYTYYKLAQELNLDCVECMYISPNEKYLNNAYNDEAMKLKQKIIRRDGNKCYICGQKVTTSGDQNNINRATIDHVLPKAHGGTGAYKNLKCCCRFCNQLKADAQLTDELKIEIKLRKENFVKNSKSEYFNRSKVLYA